MIRYFFAALLMVPVACVPVEAPNTSSTIIDEKIVYDAEAAYNVLATAYLEAADHMPPATKADVKAKMLQLASLLRDIRVAQRLANATDLKVKMDQFKTLQTSLKEKLL